MTSEELDKYKKLKREVTILQQALHKKNLELDAMHYVWCDGGCDSGVHRWTEDTVTEEIVRLAEINTIRLRRWYNNKLFKVKWLTMSEEEQMEWIDEASAKRKNDGL